MEDARVLLWHRDKLKLSIITDQFLQAVFDHILGRDVVKKLMQVSVRCFLFLFIFFIILICHIELQIFLNFKPHHSLIGECFSELHAAGELPLRDAGLIIFVSFDPPLFTHILLRARHCILSVMHYGDICNSMFPG
jgi:hypothetical protein